MEGVPDGRHPDWGSDDPPGAVNAGHWYDALTLFTKHFSPWLTIDIHTRRPAFGMRAIRRSFARQLGRVKQAAADHMGNIPTVIGEFGIPFDLDDKAAYRTGDFSEHVRALDATYAAMDANLLSCTIWNYTADNTNARGDMWNDEDLSIFSRDQQTDTERHPLRRPRPAGHRPPLRPQDRRRAAAHALRFEAPRLRAGVSS